MRTLDLIRAHAANDPDGTCVRLFSRRTVEGALTWRDVLERAGRAASFLEAKGIRPRDVVALMGGHELDFYAVWLGTIWLGAVPCVLPEPSVRVNREIYWTRLQWMLQFADVKLLALGSKVGTVSAEWTNQIPYVRYADIATCDGPTPEPFAAQDDDPLLLQHSAGTTGTPKSILVTHGMAERQFALLFQRTGSRRGHVFASWLPLYHDLGMIGSFLAPLRLGAAVIWLSTFEWVSSPTLLLEAIQRHRVTDVMFPNFCFAFLANAAGDGAEATDLSSLQRVYSGGEPVTESSVRAFVERYAGAGFSPAAFQVGYGMAESVAIVACSGETCAPKFSLVDKQEWLQGHRAVVAGDASVERVTHVSCGVPLEGCEVRITEEDGVVTLPPRCAGRLWVRTPFLFNGYHRRDDLNHALFDATGFYDTGDLGYLDEDGHLFVTGRRNDLIILGGRNVYPQDVEDVANGVRGVYPGRVVSFGVTQPGMGTQALVVLFESDEPEVGWTDLAGLVRREIVRSLDVDIFDARCVPRMALRKSTAGKLARAANRTWYLEGRFGGVAASLRDG